MSDYHPLSVDQVPEYLASTPALKDRYPSADELTCGEVGDGNLNLVFDVRLDGKGVAIVKQALPYLRCAGEDWPLGRQRMLFESKALAIEGR